MTQIKDGGPAFPFRGIHATDEQHDGMTLRDYFAAKAMQGMMANSEITRPDEVKICDAAYKIADAMLDEREQE